MSMGAISQSLCAPMSEDGSEPVSPEYPVCSEFMDMPLSRLIWLIMEGSSPCMCVHAVRQQTLRHTSA